MAARFQPFHRGHQAALLEYRRMARREDVLVLAVVSPCPELGVMDRELVQAAHEHHASDRNPWSVSKRLRALMAVNSSDLGAKAVVTAIPRPELGWPIIELWFPRPRVWIIRRAGIDDTFDDAKERFFAERKDDVLRVGDDTGVSGREARALFGRGDLEALRSLVPRAVHEAYGLGSASAAPARNR